MNSLIENLNQWAGQLWQFAWPMLWQSSLLIAFVFALDFLLGRKIRASVRYALWLAVLMKLLLPPTLALPTGAAWWLFHAQPVVKTPTIENYTVTYDTTPLANYVPSTVALPSPAPPQLNRAGWALLATGAISTGLLLWLVFRWWQITRMVRGATVSEDLAGLSESVRQQAGLRYRIRLKLVEGRMSPAVCGLFRPVILLPRTLAENLSPMQLRAVLLHEVFHLRRKDVWVNCAQALLQIVYWWHPLLWFANARIRRLREEAVDDAVMLALRDEADSYAPTLLEVAKLAFRRPLLSLGLVGIMESRSALRQRIERLVDFRAPRKAGLTFVSLCGICVFSAVALPMGEAPSPAEKQSASNATPTEPQPQFALMFAMTHPESEEILKRQLLEAGVKIPPTIIHDFNNGRLFARGTKEQLVLVQQTIWRLNGYSPQEVAAATNIPDYAVKIPVDEPSTTQLYSRTFKISMDLIYANLLKQTGAQSNVVNSTAVAVAFRELFTELGLNLESPKGKSVFYNEKLGKLFVKATASDVDVIECAVMGLNQSSTQSGSGYSPSVDATNIVGITGVSAGSNSKVDTRVQPAQVEKQWVMPRAKVASPIANAYATNKLSYTGPGRQSIINKLDRIRLDNVSFDSLPLNEVLRFLAKQSKLRDSDHDGINFLINSNPDKSGQTIDPATGLPVSPADNGEPVDVGSFIVKIPSLTNVRLADVLDAIVTVCDHPIKYTVRDFAVVFSVKGPETPQLFARAFKVDPNIFYGLPEFVNNTNSSASASAAARKFFTRLGVDLESPKGKSVFYNDRLGKLFVKATASDLDTIERGIEMLNTVAPQIPADVTNGVSSADGKTIGIVNAGVMADSNFVAVANALKQRSEVESLKEPEVTTTSGRSVNRAPASISQSVQAGRSEIVRKLPLIHLERVGFAATPLQDVLRYLSQQARASDPEKQGINFLIHPNLDGLEQSDQTADSRILSALVTIDPPLANASLGDVLDAVVGGASEPIYYSIQDFAIVFIAGKPPQPLYSRAFQVDPRTFFADLKRTGVVSDKAADEALLARNFFESLGVNWESPPGKALFYGDKRGNLFVKATESDLDTIGRALSALNQVAPQIHIKARFVEVPKGTLDGLKNVIAVTNPPALSNQVAGLVGILTDKNFRAVLPTLEARSDVETLAEPEVTTTSGRQTQMRATTKQDIVFDLVVTRQMETGPTLDVIPYVLSDGYTINLTVIPSLTEFLGYDTSTNTMAGYNRDGKKIDVPKLLPRFATQQMVTSLNLWDNQTVIIAGLPETTYVGGNVVPGKPKTNDKELLIFITATIVDPAGNRVHSDDVLPFAQTGIPSQPEAK